MSASTAANNNYNNTNTNNYNNNNGNNDISNSSSSNSDNSLPINNDQQSVAVAAHADPQPSSSSSRRFSLPQHPTPMATSSSAYSETYASASLPPYPMLPPITNHLKEFSSSQQPSQGIPSPLQPAQSHPTLHTPAHPQPMQQSAQYASHAVHFPLAPFKLPEHVATSVPHYLKEIQAYPVKYDTANKADQAARAGYYVYPSHDPYSVPHHPHHPQQPQQHPHYSAYQQGNGANGAHTNGHATNGHGHAAAYHSHNYAAVYPPPSHAIQQQQQQPQQQPLQLLRPPTPIRQTLSTHHQQQQQQHHPNNVAGFPTTMPVVTTQPVVDSEVVPVAGNLRLTRNTATAHSSTSSRVTNVCQGLTLSDCRKRQFHLVIRQQPSRARSCGFGEKDRRPIDPPPVIQLLVSDQMGRPVDIQRELPFYVMHVRLASEDGTQNMDMIRNNTSMLSRALMGSLAASVNTLQDLDGSTGNFFIFPSVSVRIEGIYRLRFSLINIITTIEPDNGPCSAVLAEVLSERFTVYPAKKFPGMTDSTELMVHFAKQGMKLVIRKDVKSKYTRQRGRASTLSRTDDHDHVNGNGSESDGEESDTPSSNGEDTMTMSVVAGSSVSGGTSGSGMHSSTTERHDTLSKSSQESGGMRRGEKRRRGAGPSE